MYKTIESQVSDCIEETIGKLQSSNICLKNDNTFLQYKSAKDALKDLYDRCVITPTSKASDNVALIFKNFHALTLLRKHKITNPQSTNTYEYCNNITMTL